MIIMIIILIILIMCISKWLMKVIVILMCNINIINNMCNNVW